MGELRTMTAQKLRIALIGQSMFAGEVFKLLRQNGHEIVGVFTVPDREGHKEDPLATMAKDYSVPVFKIKSWRLKGQLLPDVLEKYKSVNAELNVLPYCTQFIPTEVTESPRFKTIVYHPSLLPRHRGASSINWTLIEGDKESGFTIFWADDGLDTGPILLQKRCAVEPNDTVDSLYGRFMYPEGVKGMAEAVDLIAHGVAPRVTQSLEGATYDPMLNKKELSQIKWDQSAASLHNFIRGLDKVPGAWSTIDRKEVCFFGSRLWTVSIPTDVRHIQVDGLTEPAKVHSQGLLLRGSDGHYVNVTQIKIDGKLTSAAKYGQVNGQAGLTNGFGPGHGAAAAMKLARDIWAAILSTDITEDSDFFKLGGRSMDVTRLVEEMKDKVKVALCNDDIYMNSSFGEFFELIAEKMASGSGTAVEKSGRYTVKHSQVVLNANNMEVRFPNQLFINGQFVDGASGQTFGTTNPANESEICRVALATADDVDSAVKSAQAAFTGEWRKMSARDRARLMFKLADLMEEYKEELATIESLDSGAVYTLALKTHIGMSIDAIRYFAGWCDKIQGSVIPINHARPMRNLTFTKKEAIGVCGIVTPWNYPLMMVCWKLAPCLAAGNTVILKPAQVSPLTALKLAELSVQAGFPKGVINVLPGSGSECGQAIADHPGVLKLGFTGSTSTGKIIMKSCAQSNLKKTSLELGGKSPLIIFADCDLDNAVKQAMGSVFFNKGENCIAAGRLFIEEPIYKEFLDRVVADTKKIVIGDPLDRSTSHGPQNHLAHLQKLLDYVQRGLVDGATLVLGGSRVHRQGYYFEPTIFTGVEDHMYIAKEESFGPIMIISTFKSGGVEEVVRRANLTEYGLASGVFTRDLSKAMYVVDNLDAGTVFVNTYNKTDVAAPFGGFKQSGFGKDLGEEALHEYLRIKCVTMEY